MRSLSPQAIDPAMGSFMMSSKGIIHPSSPVSSTAAQDCIAWKSTSPASPFQTPHSFMAAGGSGANSCCAKSQSSWTSRFFSSAAKASPCVSWNFSPLKESLSTDVLDADIFRSESQLSSMRMSSVAPESSDTSGSSLTDSSSMSLGTFDADGFKAAPDSDSVNISSADTLDGDVLGLPAEFSSSAGASAISVDAFDAGVNGPATNIFASSQGAVAMFISTLSSRASALV
mmetsp:Transcript_56783/g.158106  ORF Transcript_56783/g.158106 Transcript_56783/m.158106 type:complete len:230 (+) Transcript_56783:486-1175(+)